MVVTEPEQLDWPKGTTAPAYWSPGTLVRGRCGMGEVYRVYGEAILRSVAIKICRDPLADMAAEARILAQLRHPDVISVHEYVQGAPAFVAMDVDSGCSVAPEQELAAFREFLVTSFNDMICELCAS